MPENCSIPSVEKRRQTVSDKQKVVARRVGYKLLANGELWTTGKHPYMAGYVSDPGNIDAAIENHEEELRVLAHGTGWP